MHISAFKQSNFLIRHDVGNGMLVTIRDITQENVSKAGAPEELRYCLHFDECDKPMVCNATNAAIIAGITKSEDTDSWPGHKIVIFDDPNVSFSGKLVGGIRVRAPRGQAAKAVTQQPKPATKPEPARGRDYDAQPDSPPDDESTPF